MIACIIIVPCFNEAARLNAQAFIAFVKTQPAIHVLFVNDGSTDDTREHLVSVCDAEPGQITMMDIGSNVGKGEAVRLGVLAALERQPRFVGYWDADLATPLDVIPEFQKLLVERPYIQIVMGARAKAINNNIVRCPLRNCLGRIFAVLTSITLGVRVSDSQCGAKLIRVTEGLEAIFYRPFKSRWIFDVELLSRLQLIGKCTDSWTFDNCIYEYPLPRWSECAGSHFHWSDRARALVELATIAWSKQE